MFHTISQHFTWPSLRTQVEDFMKHWNTCQATLQCTKKEAWACTCPEQTINC
jgi:hypothetical protein